MNVIDNFLRESNAIEGILREVCPEEMAEFESFLFGPLTMKTVMKFQAFTAPGMGLREKPGMNVSVGRHIAPPGGPQIRIELSSLLDHIRERMLSPHQAHCLFLTLHPFMDGNGRTSRAVWAWQMLASEQDPFSLPFLHRFYYQTLDASDGRLRFWSRAFATEPRLKAGGVVTDPDARE